MRGLGVEQLQGRTLHQHCRLQVMFEHLCMTHCASIQELIPEHLEARALQQQFAVLHRFRHLSMTLRLHHLYWDWFQSTCKAAPSSNSILSSTSLADAADASPSMHSCQTWSQSQGSRLQPYSTVLGSFAQCCCCISHGAFMQELVPEHLQGRKVQQHCSLLHSTATTGRT